MALVTLIRPPLLVPKWSDSGPITPPIGPAYLAAGLQRAGHAVRIIDAVGEAPFQVTRLFNDRMLGVGLTNEQIAERVDPTSDMVGVSCMFSQDWPELRRIIERVRQRLPRVPIVAGGEHITAVREFTLQSCPEVDYCVLGEGEETIVELVRAVASGGDVSKVAGVLYRSPDGAVRQTAPRGRIQSIDEIPPPAWDLVDLNPYLDNGLGFGVNRGRSMPILATRGCPYQCTFCSSPHMWTTRWSARDPGNVLDEIESYMDRYRATNFDFYDLTAIIKREWIVAFCELILARGRQFTWQLPSGTRTEAIDEQVTRLLYASGCRNISYAPESGSVDVLNRIKKRMHLDRMAGSIRSAVRNGLNLKLNIIMGFPDETRAEIMKTIGLLARLGGMGVHDASVSLFSPYPGSELFNTLRANGAIPELSDEYFLSLGTYKDFSQTTCYSNGIGARELNAYRLIGMSAFYGVQYLSRPWRLWRTVANFLSHREESRLDKSLRDLVHRLLPGFKRRRRAIPAA
ncbi:MAG: B12-binding domain-containing radical SAM protein [Phycisphaerales bacterium]|nr:B12-binding domain-containing radical SAM protein [Phycisphaerales bacterium]